MRSWQRAAAAVLAAALLAGCAKDDPDIAPIRRYRERGDTEALARETENKKAKVAASAVEALGTLGSKALPHVQKALQDERPEVREAAAVAYARAAGRNVPVGSLAATARSDPSPDVRAAAVTGLGQVRAIDEIETLLAALEDEDRTVRLRASVAVARIIGRRYETYIDGTPEERHQAVNQLRAVWPTLAGPTREYLKSQQGAKP